MAFKISDNEHGSIWYFDQVEPHVKNTLNDENKEIVNKIQELDKRISTIETKDNFKTYIWNGFMSFLAVIISLLSWIFS